MVQTIQVLCIHLRELEKVNELCKDFCNRYITCLKQKYLVDVISELESSDTSLSGGAPDDALSDAGFPPHLGSNSGKQGDSQTSATASPSFRPADYPSPYAYANQHYAAAPGRPTASYFGPNAQPFVPYGALNGGPQPQRPAPVNVSAVMCAGLDYASNFVLASPSNGAVLSNAAGVQHRSTSVEADTTAKAQKRGVLPKQATQVMKSWLFQHLVVSPFVC